MNIGKAVAICENLDSEEYSLEEKALAIHEVMNMPTHMSVKKDTLVGMIKWLWNFNLEVSESHNGKRIVAIPTPHGRLIDADKLMKVIEDNDYTLSSRLNTIDRGMFTIGIKQAIDESPTIIEAEE